MVKRFKKILQVSIGGSMCKKSSDARDASDPFTFLFITSLPPGKQPGRQDALSPIQQAMFLEPLARTKKM